MARAELGVRKQFGASTPRSAAAAAAAKDVASETASDTSQDAAQRPRTHCGAMHRPCADEEIAAEFQECGLAGAHAIREIASGCKSCIKLRLRLENEERARVKAQEQLLALHAENLRLRGLRRAEEAGASAPSELRRPPPAPADANVMVPTPPVASAPSAPKPQRCRPNSGGKAAVAVAAKAEVDSRGYPARELSGGSSPRPGGVGAQDLDSTGRVLEGYRREVQLLRETLREREQGEASFAERQRKQLEEFKSSKQEWEAQVAGLVCEVQDLEARNRELECSLRAAERTLAAATVASMANSSTTASGRDGTPSDSAATSSCLEEPDAAACEVWSSAGPVLE